MLSITISSAVILTLLYIGLSLRVIMMRRAGGPSLGLGNDETFIRAVRAHANLGEYMPLFLFLTFLLELQLGSVIPLFLLSLVFVGGRLSHAIGFGFLGTGPWRTLGMVATISVLVAQSGYLCLLLILGYV